MWSDYSIYSNSSRFHPQGGVRFRVPVSQIGLIKTTGGLPEQNASSGSQCPGGHHCRPHVTVSRGCSFCTRIVAAIATSWSSQYIAFRSICHDTYIPSFDMHTCSLCYEQASGAARRLGNNDDDDDNARDDLEGCKGLGVETAGQLDSIVNHCIIQR